jgi:hypothetical protein
MNQNLPSYWNDTVMQVFLKYEKNGESHMYLDEQRDNKERSIIILNLIVHNYICSS